MTCNVVLLARLDETDLARLARFEFLRNREDYEAELFVVTDGDYDLMYNSFKESRRRNRPTLELIR